mmetsp:Transcript_28214/g.43565  ORF Transcript_28214/g.43565 Transcript_28214/m.43565 type:complete len:120 (+) Transcript_28214:80-439(+)
MKKFINFKHFLSANGAGKKCYILRSKKIVNFLVVTYHSLTTKGGTIITLTISVRGIHTVDVDSAPHGLWCCAYCVSKYKIQCATTFEASGVSGPGAGRNGSSTERSTAFFRITDPYALA